MEGIFRSKKKNWLRRFAVIKVDQCYFTVRTLKPTLYQNQGISLSTEEKVGTFADNKYPSLQIKISGVSGRFECLLCEIIVRS